MAQIETLCGGWICKGKLFARCSAKDHISHRFSHPILGSLINKHGSNVVAVRIGANGDRVAVCRDCDALSLLPALGSDDPRSNQFSALLLPQNVLCSLR